MTREEVNTLIANFNLPYAAQSTLVGCVEKMKSA